MIKPTSRHYSNRYSNHTHPRAWMPNHLENTTMSNNNILEYVVIGNSVYAVREDGSEEFCAEYPTEAGAEKLAAKLNQQLIDGED